MRVALNITQLSEGQAVGWRSAPSDPIQTVIVVKTASGIKGYRNRCPHLGVPLNWQDDAFSCSEQRYLQCATHGALFEPETGLCVAGPCKQQSLIPVEIEIDATGSIQIRDDRDTSNHGTQGTL